MTSLDHLLESYRTSAISERDKGTAFEKLVAAWLIADPVQSKRFAQVELWSDWARRQELDRTDIGIDLVGTLHDGGIAAIQCKFFDVDPGNSCDGLARFGRLAVADQANPVRLPPCALGGDLIFRVTTTKVNVIECL